MSGRDHHYPCHAHSPTILVEAKQARIVIANRDVRPIGFVHIEVVADWITFECIIREADEEASLPDKLVRDGARSVGTVTYIYVTEEKYVGEDGFIYPECQWIYDLELPADLVPQPKDGEVDEFYLCDVEQVKRDLANDKYKHNCALVTLDFFIRHSILTDDDEPELAAIKERMHRQMPFPGPHQSDWRHSR